MYVHLDRRSLVSSKLHVFKEFAKIVHKGYQTANISCLFDLFYLFWVWQLKFSFEAIGHVKTSLVKISKKSVRDKTTNTYETSSQTEAAVT